MNEQTRIIQYFRKIKYEPFNDEIEFQMIHMHWTTAVKILEFGSTNVWLGDLGLWFFGKATVGRKTLRELHMAMENEPFMDDLSPAIQNGYVIRC